MAATEAGAADDVSAMNVGDDFDDWQNIRTISLGFAAVYVAYYLFFIVKKPTVSCNDKMRQFLEAHCPILSKNFWPTAWCIEARAQTVIRTLFAPHIQIPYEREILALPDGGEVALDWVVSDSSTIPSEQRPTVIILPGLIGSSHESYARNLSSESVKLGFRSVVFNYRGNGGAELKTARTYCASNTDDLSAVITHIEKRYNGSPIMAAGVSLGGMILINYLAQTGKDCRLSAAMAISVPWNTFESAQSLEQPINAFLFNQSLANHLKQAVERNAHLFRDKCDLEQVYRSRTIRDFDERFTARLFGYDSHEEYYHDACIDRKVHDVQIPLLCLNAADDPFSPGQFIPVEEARKSEKVTIVMTSRGGHLAFLDGVLGLAGPGYMDRLFSEFFHAIFQHGGDLAGNKP